MLRQVVVRQVVDLRFARGLRYPVAGSDPFGPRPCVCSSVIAFGSSRLLLPALLEEGYAVDSLRLLRDKTKDACDTDVDGDG
jgi:hypothetical protein